MNGFLHGWVARFGVPDDVVADRGAQFTSSLWKQFHDLLGVKASNTTAYHPQANGMVERVHRQLKASLMARENQTDWMSHLPFVLLGIRSAWRADLDCSPAELTYGAALHLQGECVDPTPISASTLGVLKELHGFMVQVVPTEASDHSGKNRHFHVPPTLETATHVFVRRDARAPPLTRPYSGPYKVAKVGEKYFEVEINGRIDKVSIDRLKRAFVQCYDREEKPSETDQEITQPQKKRGRPTRAMLEERERARERERERDAAGQETPHHETRFGRISRPPCRL